MLHLGLDIGGTKMEAVLLNAAGECVYRQRRPTHKESYQAFMQQLLGLIATVRDWSERYRLLWASACRGLSTRKAA